jgi:hypothetical protein
MPPTELKTGEPDEPVQPLLPNGGEDPDAFPDRVSRGCKTLAEHTGRQLKEFGVVVGIWLCFLIPIGIILLWVEKLHGPLWDDRADCPPNLTLFIIAAWITLFVSVAITDLGKRREPTVKRPPLEPKNALDQKVSDN